MKDERIIELVNGDIDGINTPSEKAELTNLLENPSVKELVDEMHSLDRLLASVPMVDPPASLKRGVMDAIARKEASVRSTSKVSLLDRVLAPFIQRPAWAVTYAFATGLIVGLGVFSIVDSTGPEPATVQGTIISAAPAVLGETLIEAGDATATITVTRLGDELKVDVDLIATDATELALTPDGGEPLVIESLTGSPAYSVVIPPTSAIRVTLTSGLASDEALLTIGDVNE